MLNKLLKSVLDQDTAPVVVCDIDDIIVYMNPCAIKRYHKDLTGRSIKDCHPPKANEQIDKVVACFKEKITTSYTFIKMTRKTKMCIWLLFVMMTML